MDINTYVRNLNDLRDVIDLVERKYKDLQYENDKLIQKINDLEMLLEQKELEIDGLYLQLETIHNRFLDLW